MIHHAALLTGAFSFYEGRLGVEFFFVLSGIVILTAHWGDIDRPSTVPSFAWKRFRRVYPVYWVVLLPQLIWIVASPRQINLYQRNPWVVASSILLVHLNSIHTTVTVAWTLFHEVLFYAFFALLLLNRRVGVVVMALWLTISLFFLYQPNSCWTIFFSPLHLLFALGMLAAWIMRRERTPWPFALIAIGMLIFVRACFTVDRFPESGNITNLIAGFGATVAILGLVELERRGQLRVYAWLALLGDASYSIYLVHYPFLFALTPVTLRLLSHYHLPVLSGMISLTLLATAFGLIFHLLIERPLLRWLGGFRHPALRTA